MIFRPEELLELVADHAAKLGVPVPVDYLTMRAIVAQAELLAGSVTGDEPAALFYACARHAGLLGKVGRTFFDDIAVAQADAVGLVLHATELDLVLLRGRIAFGAVAWEEVRADFASWLCPPGQRPKHTTPKRPR
jgi:hypothetical protein